MSADPLSGLFERLAHGIYPPADEQIEVLPPPAGAAAGVFAFTAHHVVAADVAPDWVRDRCPAQDLAAPLSPAFLDALAHRTGTRPGAVDLLVCDVAVEGEPALELVEREAADHPRAQRARRYRRDVRVFETPDGSGLLAVGRGVAGRWEAGFEVRADARGRGLGRALAAAARTLAPAGEGIFLQVAVGNAASLRAVLAAGYSPVGTEVLFTQPPS